MLFLMSCYEQYMHDYVACKSSGLLLHKKSHSHFFPCSMKTESLRFGLGASCQSFVYKETSSRTAAARPVIMLY